jgi:hypothetical protein
MMRRRQPDVARIPLENISIDGLLKAVVLRRHMSLTKARLSIEALSAINIAQSVGVETGGHVPPLRCHALGSERETDERLGVLITAAAAAATACRTSKVIHLLTL